MEVDYASFEEFWQPMLHAAGPVGALVRSLDDGELARLAEETQARLAVPDGPFTLEAHAVAFRGTA